MADSTQDSTQDDRPIWSLSRDEQRMLLITFAGGLASIVAGVLFLGAALALIRVAGRGSGLLIGFLGFVTVGQIVALYVVVVTGLRRGIWIPALGLTYCLLLWVGLAAGVK